jgi:uncharacterized protein YbjT (DUF2867 family)
MQKMKNVIITGASGMIGSMILARCLEHKDINRVTSIVRKPSGKQHHKLVEVVHGDFTNFESISHHFHNQDICFYCIGVYTGQVPKDEFRKITVEYTLAFASALRNANEKTTFCFLSGDGADMSEKSRIMFARDKGAAESILFNLQFDKTYTFRPGYIYPSVPRKEPNRAYVFFRYAYKYVLRHVYPDIGLTSGQLARVMFQVGLNGTERQVLGNREIRKLAENLP